MAKTKQKWDLSKIIGVAHAVLVFVLYIVDGIDKRIFKDFDSKGGKLWLVFLLCTLAIILALSFRASKSIYAAIGMILFSSVFQPLAEVLLRRYFVLTSLDRYNVRNLMNMGCWSLFFVSGIMALIAHGFARKEAAMLRSGASVSEASTCRQSKEKWQSVVFVTLFYISLCVVALGMLLYNSSSSFEDYRGVLLAQVPLVEILSLDFGILEIGTLSAILLNVLKIDSLSLEFGHMGCTFVTLIPTYLIYLGVHHPFSEKKNKPLIAIGVIATAILGILSIKSYAGEAIYIVLLLIALFISFFGYFWLCKKWKSPYTFVLVAVGAVVLPPLVLFAIIVTVMALIVWWVLKRCFGGKSSAPAQKKTWEVTENGVTYTIEEGQNGTYFDDCNREWATDDGGTTFYRK